MTLKVPNVGESAMLKDALGKTTPAALTLKLFVNNITPGDADTAATYTEMSTLGYAAKTLATSSWTEATDGTSSVATYPVQSFVFSAGTAVTVYGYYVVGVDGIIRWAERFASPFTAQTLNDTISITPKFTFASAA